MGSTSRSTAYSGLSDVYIWCPNAARCCVCGPLSGSVDHYGSEPARCGLRSAAIEGRGGSWSGAALASTARVLSVRRGSSDCADRKQGYCYAMGCLSVHHHQQQRAVARDAGQAASAQCHHEESRRTCVLALFTLALLPSAGVMD